ncbi:hypothetical protein SK128_002593 [Halocaridina rubra]|uniref:Heparanase n=1 Tax=Halocaridina rubra TaxID=373956 RepID=A0AAN9ACF8_HALRR
MIIVIQIISSCLRVSVYKVSFLRDEAINPLERHRDIMKLYEFLFKFFFFILVLGYQSNAKDAALVGRSSAVGEISGMIRDVSPYFLSVALSPYLIHDGLFHGFVSSQRARTLTRGLAPALLRMGGSAANFLTFDPDAVVDEARIDDYWNFDDRELILNEEYEKAAFENFTITQADWRNITEFVEAVNMILLFDLNQFFRVPNGDWDPSNAKMLLDDANDRDLSIIWQLGNEPNSYNYNYGYNFTGERDARDFGQLNDVLRNVFSEALMVGPDITRPKFKPQQDTQGAVEDEEGYCRDSVQFLEEFLSELTVNITALSWHHYYLDGHTSTVDDFISLETMDVLTWQIPIVTNLRDQYISGTPVWLTETSSAFGGGAEGLSNRYVAGFLWLDKLGLAASLGVDMVARQTLFGKRYALIDYDYTPLPDYWLSLAYKRLVGERVLNITLSNNPSSLRLYSHCQQFGSASFEPGNVVVYGMNVGNITSSVVLAGVHSNHTIEQYLLEPMGQGLVSRDVMLNGEMLELANDEELPELMPLLLPQQEFEIPPTTFGFWVIKQAHVADCI